MLLAGELLCGVSQYVLSPLTIFAHPSRLSVISPVSVGRFPDPYRCLRFRDLPGRTSTISHNLCQSVLGVWTIHCERVSVPNLWEDFAERILIFRRLPLIQSTPRLPRRRGRVGIQGTLRSSGLHTLSPWHRAIFAENAFRRSGCGLFPSPLAYICRQSLL